jgi:glycyl-tRNA synthetase
LQYFVFGEVILELYTITTSAPPFEASGHVPRFVDWMVKDTKTGNILRDDHLVGSFIEARLTADREARDGATAMRLRDGKDEK